MTPVLRLALGALQGDMARLDQIALNLANAQTTAYKREAGTAGGFARQVEEGAAVAGTVHVDATPGALRHTGRSLDVALAGPGWFEVTTERGLAYTRQGAFRLDAQGRIVTPDGHAVQGTAGEIRLAHGAEPVVDAQGWVYDLAPGAPAAKRVEDAVGQLKVVQVATGAPLERVGRGLVRLLADPAPAAADLQVRQGHLENSNVDPAREMVQLVQTMRHAETLQKVALGYDDMLGSAIRRLGETS